MFNLMGIGYWGFMSVVQVLGFRNGGSLRESKGCVCGEESGGVWWYLLPKSLLVQPTTCCYSGSCVYKIGVDSESIMDFIGLRYGDVFGMWLRWV